MPPRSGRKEALEAIKRSGAGTTKGRRLKRRLRKAFLGKGAEPVDELDGILQGLGYREGWADEQVSTGPVHKPVDNAGRIAVEP